MTTVYAASGGDYSDYRIYAIFATRELAEQFVAHTDSYADRVEEYRVFDRMPKRVAWHYIECVTGRTRRGTIYAWENEGAPFVGFRRNAWSYSRWSHGERAFGQERSSVEKVWVEQHPTEPLPVES